VVDSTVADLASNILDSLQDRVEDEFLGLIEEVRADNEDSLKSVNWDKVDAEKIVEDPYMKEILVGLVQRVIDGLSQRDHTDMFRVDD
jgi:hypothetical protein